MSDILLSLLICICAATSSSTYKIGDCGIRYEVNRYQSVISYGESSTLNEFPWHVALYSLRNESRPLYICGGSIILPYVVLTAAHCIFDEGSGQIDNNDIVVAVGKYNSSWNHWDKYEKRYKVIGKKIKSTYIGFTNRFGDDIALLALNESIKFSDVVMPVCIDWVSQYELINSTDYGLVVGWGFTENDTISEKLLVAKLQHYNFTSCRAKSTEGYTPFITSDKFCAESKNLSRVEQGDSGGGLVFARQRTDDEVKYFIYGVLSNRDKENLTNIATYTNISLHMPWLNSTLKNIEAESIVREVCGRKLAVNYTDSRGHISTHSDYPWLATIYIERLNKFFGVRCVGNIIHQRAILTSAWCVGNIPSLYEPAEYRIVVGKHELNMEKTEQYEQKLNIAKIHKHPSYLESDIRYENELAIIVVDEDIKFNNAVIPICIDWDRKLNHFNSSTGKIVSWNTDECHCQEIAKYQYFSIDECYGTYGNTDDYKNYVTSDKVCGKFVNGTHFKNKSDIGSGLIFSKNATTKHYMYGIVSTGRPPNEEFITFTNVEANLRWISDTLDTIYNAGGS